MLTKCVNLHDIWTQIATIGVKPLISIIVQRVTALAAFVHYNSASRPLLSQSGLRGGRGVRAVGEFRKKVKYKRKKWAVQM